MAARLSAESGKKGGGAASKIADLGFKGAPRPILAYITGKLRHWSIISEGFNNLGQILEHQRSVEFVGSVSSKMWFPP